MANSLIVPPYRAALLTNADGSPVVREDSANGPIATERQWYMFWRQLGEQVNTAAQQIEGLEGLVTYGNHLDRPDGEFQHDGALYVEQDRGSVLYQNQGGVWQYIAGIMYGTLSPDQRPTDLGPSADVGFQFRTTTDPARAFAWNGGQWVETTPIRYGTHAERLAAVIANLVSGMLWMETDRGSVIYQNQGGVWLYLAGTMWGTLSPDQRPADLGVRDAGFDFRTTVAPPQEFIWNQTAWIEVTPQTNSLLYATATANVTLTTVAQDIPGAALTITKAGVWLVHGVFYMTQQGDAGSFLVGSAWLNGATPSLAVAMSLAPGSWTTMTQQWRHVAAAAGEIIKLQCSKSGGTGGSALSYPNTSISATWISP